MFQPVARDFSASWDARWARFAAAPSLCGVRRAIMRRSRYGWMWCGDRDECGVADEVAVKIAENR
jgi:hypothetical protein